MTAASACPGPHTSAGSDSSGKSSATVGPSRTRELDTQGVARELLAHLKDWKLAQEDKETRVISLLPVLARFSGHYPEDFSPEGEDTDDR